MMMMGRDTQFSQIVGLVVICNSLQNLIPEAVRNYLDKLWWWLYTYFFPSVKLRFHEYSTNGVRNEAYSSIKTYLGEKAKSCQHATNLTVDKPPNIKSLLISLDENEGISDEFHGVCFQWRSLTEKIQDNGQNKKGPKEKKSYLLTSHVKHRDLITEMYLKTVIEKGKDIEIKNRKRKLYSNKRSYDWYWPEPGKWNHINFHHPANFNTLAMDPKTKQKIISDLDAFKKGKEYYTKVGKAWKRGYLLYGPPGTGKSTMIAAIANYMDYDIYDLELTSVDSNSDLKELLIDTRSKSILIIEDIDCSADLTKKRKEAKKDDGNEDDSDDDKEEDEEKDKDKDKKDSTRVTLSGLLNFIDGIWSACGEERIIIFTTNHVEKLDPALIRRGRMDMHIEMSYCKFEAFKILAKNYLNIDSHPLFEEIKTLLDINKVSPCDVAENLMPKSDLPDVDGCLRTLIEAIKANAIAEAEKEKLLKEKEKKEKEKKKTKIFNRFDLFNKNFSFFKKLITKCTRASSNERLIETN